MERDMEQVTETAATTPPPSDTDTATAPESAPADLQTAAPTLTVKFNKQEYQLPMDKAVAYAQQGMKLETVQPLLDKLKGLAEQQGQSLATFVEALCEAAPADLNERLAREFCALRQECPDVTAFDQLPDGVVQYAVDSGTPLLVAYWRHCYGEHRRIERARAEMTAAAAASVGTQRGESAPTTDPAVEAMVQGVWG